MVKNKLIMLTIILMCALAHNNQLRGIHSGSDKDDRDPQKITGNFGGGSICLKLFNFIRELLPEGATLLEFGSGWASGQFSKYYTVYSVEHDEKWVGAYTSHYIYAPLVGNWYDEDSLRKNLPESYHLLLIDGPPGYYPSDPGRYGFMEHLHLFNLNIPIIIDDVERDAEYKLLIDLASLLERPYEIVPCGSYKKFGYIPFSQ